MVATPSITPPTNGSTADATHICGICNKVFDRRDLRDRHKRRCVQSANRPRASKQKSCLPCARSKLKCNLDTPSCLRCLDRNIPCEYPAQISNAIRRPTTNQNSLSTEQSGTTTPTHDVRPPAKSISSTEPIPTDSIDVGMAPLPATAPATVPPIFNMEDDTELHWGENFTDQSSYSLFDIESFQPLPPGDQSTSMEGLESTSTSGRPHVSNGFCDLDMVDLHASLPQGIPNIPTALDRDHIYTSASSSYEDNFLFHEPEPNDEQAMSLLDFLGAPGGAEYTNTAHDFITHPSTPSSGQTPSRPFGGLSDRSNGSFDAYRPALTAVTTGENSPDRMSVSSFYGKRPILTPAMSMSSSSWPAANGDCNSQKLACSNDEELIAVIRSYPKRLLEDNFYPPFVHHRLYRSSQGGVKEYLAIALCCVSAHSTIVEGSAPFIRNMVNTERERLIKGFHSQCSSGIDSLAALHAMCIYQIIGLLDARSFTEKEGKIRKAELHHAYLLKMTRRMCQEHLKGNKSAEAEEIDWKTWLIAETLRRTVFLVNIINTLAYRSHALNQNYYEPLDDDLIHSLALPAPDVLWNACSQEEWEAAKEALGQESRTKMTIPMVIEGLERARKSPSPGGAPKLEDLQELTKLIVACSQAPANSG
ncbi:MAG: hypothetical protein M1827_007269 [Pycnora praestabilis]|nr:MAG: hypothetical protein M1827_007269 [Pycnora praestabilis]